MPRVAIPRIENLLPWSESLADWDFSGASASANVAANPNDGAQTADAMVEDGSTGLHFAAAPAYTGVIAGALETFSVWLKAAENTWILFAVSNAAAYFSARLDSGVFGATQVGTDIVARGIVAYANDWYRIWAAYPRRHPVALVPRIYAATGDGAVSYTGTPGRLAYYLWGAQITAGIGPSLYVATTATPIAGPVRSSTPTRAAASGRVATTGRVPL